MNVFDHKVVPTERIIARADNRVRVEISQALVGELPVIGVARRKIIPLIESMIHARSILVQVTNVCDRAEEVVEIGEGVVRCSVGKRIKAQDVLSHRVEPASGNDVVRERIAQKAAAARVWACRGRIIDGYGSAQCVAERRKIATPEGFCRHRVEARCAGGVAIALIIKKEEAAITSIISAKRPQNLFWK